jgi:hypothetical protein
VSGSALPTLTVLPKMHGSGDREHKAPKEAEADPPRLCGREGSTVQVATAGKRPRRCTACDRQLAGKGHHRTTFRSLFGAVPVRVRRLLA